jgi:hypothetical protein
MGFLIDVSDGHFFDSLPWVNLHNPLSIWLACLIIKFTDSSSSSKQPISLLLSSSLIMKEEIYVHTKRFY